MGGKEKGKGRYKHQIGGTEENWKLHIQTVGSDRS
jgi:hypothetical protein